MDSHKVIVIVLLLMVSILLISCAPGKAIAGLGTETACIGLEINDCADLAEHSNVDEEECIEVLSFDAANCKAEYEFIDVDNCDCEGTSFSCSVEEESCSGYFECAETTGEDCESLETDLDDCQDVLIDNIEDRDNAESDYDGCVDEYGELLDNFEQAESDFETAKEELETCEGELEDIGDERDELESAVEESSDDFSECQSELEVLANEVSDIMQCLEAFDAILEEITDCTEEAEELGSELSACKNDNKCDDEEECEACSLIEEDLDGKYEECGTITENAEKKEEECESIGDEADILSARDEKSEECNDLQGVVDANKQDHAEKIEEYGAKEQECENLEEPKETAESSLEEARDNRDEKADECQGLGDTLTDLNPLVEEQEEICGDIKSDLNECLGECEAYDNVELSYACDCVLDSSDCEIAVQDCVDEMSGEELNFDCDVIPDCSDVDRSSCSCDYECEPDVPGCGSGLADDYGCDETIDLSSADCDEPVISCECQTDVITVDVSPEPMEEEEEEGEAEPSVPESQYTFQPETRGEQNSGCTPRIGKIPYLTKIKKGSYVMATLAGGNELTLRCSDDQGCSLCDEPYGCVAPYTICPEDDNSNLCKMVETKSAVSKIIVVSEANSIAGTLKLYIRGEAPHSRVFTPAETNYYPCGETCNDGVNNDDDDDVDTDADENIDCADSDCAGKIGMTQDDDWNLGDLGYGKCEERDGCLCDINEIEITCDDGFSNDGDRLIDCADPDCEGVEVERGDVCQSQEVTCNDRFDNDGDGLKDCEDPDCEGDEGGREPELQLCELNEFGLCHDDFDNDADDLEDCADPDCVVECRPIVDTTRTARVAAPTCMDVQQLPIAVPGQDSRVVRSARQLTCENAGCDYNWEDTPEDDSCVGFSLTECPDIKQFEIWGWNDLKNLCESMEGCAYEPKTGSYINIEGERRTRQVVGSCVPDCTDNDGDGYSVEGGICGTTDCYDNDNTISPGAEEICDKKDNDCNGQIDEESVCVGTEQGRCMDIQQLPLVSGDWPADQLRFGRRNICQDAGCSYESAVDPAEDLCRGIPESCPDVNTYDYWDITRKRFFCDSVPGCSLAISGTDVICKADCTDRDGDGFCAEVQPGHIPPPAGKQFGDCNDALLATTICAEGYDCVDNVCVYGGEVCDDNFDNDFDEMVDCNDPDCVKRSSALGFLCCQATTDCDEPEYYSCTNNLCQIRTTETGLCADEIDNDNDGMVDCNDPDCSTLDGPEGFTCCQNNADCDDGYCTSNVETADNGLFRNVCVSVYQVCDEENYRYQICGDDGYCAAGTCLPYTVEGDETCNNDIDDNNDGLEDCTDPFCAADSSCVGLEPDLEIPCQNNNQCTASEFCYHKVCTSVPSEMKGLIKIVEKLPKKGEGRLQRLKLITKFLKEKIKNKKNK